MDLIFGMVIGYFIGKVRLETTEDSYTISFYKYSKTINR